MSSRISHGKTCNERTFVRAFEQLTWWVTMPANKKGTFLHPDEQRRGAIPMKYLIVLWLAWLFLLLVFRISKNYG